jgi:hypothetical protein
VTSCHQQEASVANNSILYGLVGALGVVVVGGGLYIAKENGAFAPIPAAVVAPAPVATPAPPLRPASPPPVATPRPTPPPAAVPAGPTAAQVEQLNQLVSDARRAITRADFASADRALDQAERIDPRSSDVIAARRDLNDARQHANRDDRKVEGLVAQARAAIQRHDYAAADHLLDQAEGIDPRDRQVLQARAELNAVDRLGSGRR